VVYWKRVKKKRKDPEPEIVTASVSEASSIPEGRLKRATGQCVVCGSEVAPFSTENLCWVCRRLKISAWRDNENQSAIQE